MTEYDRFLEAVKQDESLQRSLSASVTVDDIVRIARNAGFELTETDFKKAEIGVDEADLEKVAGGGFTGCDGHFTDRPTWCPG